MTDCPTLTQTTSCNNKLPVKWRTTTTDPRGSIPKGATAFSSSSSTIPIASWRTSPSMWTLSQYLRQGSPGVQRRIMNHFRLCQRATSHHHHHHRQKQRILAMFMQMQTLLRSITDLSSSFSSKTRGSRRHAATLITSIEEDIQIYSNGESSDVPASEFLGGRSAREDAGLVAQVSGHGDVSCWSDHTNPSLLAMFYHAERLASVVELLEETDPFLRRCSNSGVRNAPRNLKDQWRCHVHEREENTSSAFSV